MAIKYRCTQCRTVNMSSPEWQGEKMTGEVDCETCGEPTVQNQMNQHVNSKNDKW